MRRAHRPDENRTLDVAGKTGQGVPSGYVEAMQVCVAMLVCMHAYMRGVSNNSILCGTITDNLNHIRHRAPAREPEVQCVPPYQCNVPWHLDFEISPRSPSSTCLQTSYMCVGSGVHTGRAPLVPRRRGPIPST